MADKDFRIQNGVLTKYCGPGGNVIIPEGVTAIGQDAFWGNESVTGVTIPKGVVKIGREAFRHCTRLASVTIPEGVKEIGGMAFLDCQELTSIDIPKSVQKLGPQMFYLCGKLTGAVIPDKVTEIGEWMFASCRSMTHVVIPKGVKVIDSRAFSCCESLTGIDIPAGVTKIGENAFHGCKKLNSVTIPEGVTSIGQDTFSECESLTGITIPEGVTEIGEEAFAFCRSLTSITIPANVTTIERSAFAGCERLERIEIAPENPRFRVENGLILSVDGKTLEFCTPGMSGVCEIPQSVRKIAWHAFYYCVNLTGVVIPAGVTSIGASAFWGCKKLASLEFPPKLKKLSSYLCLGCESLRQVTLPPQLTSIGSETFAETALESVTIPASVTTLKARAFRECHLRRAILQGELKLKAQSLGGGTFELIAEKTPFSEIPQGYKVCAVLGFAACCQSGQALPEKYRGDYLTYIRGQRKRLYPTALKHPALLHVMVSEKIIPKEDMDELLRQAAKLKRAEINAMLLEYRNRVFGDIDPELEAEKELKREMKLQIKLLETGALPVGEAKKLWSYRKKEDETLEIRGYKGDEPQVVVPGRIGKNTVSEIADPTFRAMAAVLTSVTIPASVESIGENAFEGCGKLTIHAPAGSCAERYAGEHGIPFAPEE